MSNLVKHLRIRGTLSDLSSKSKGFALDQIRLEVDDGVLMEKVRFICKNHNVDVRNLLICATTRGDVISMLAELAGSKTGGTYIKMFADAFKAFAKQDSRPIVIWLEELRQMRVAHREMLVMHMESIAWHLGLNLRVVMLIGKTKVYVGRDEATGAWIGKKRSMFVGSEKLDSFSNQYVYDARGLSSTGAEPEIEANDHKAVEAKMLEVA